MWITVKIETRDMRGAMRGSFCNCPVARAIKRRFLPRFSMIVGSTYIRVTTRSATGDGVENLVISLPEPARDFILAFDRSVPGRAPKPISFKLNIPKRFLKEAS